MTQNQIRFAEHLETKRSNLAKEQQARNELAETWRHNFADEWIRSSTLGESIRHNQTTEDIQMRSVAENERHSRAQEEETRRANMANEAETKRHNLAYEYSSLLGAQAAQTNAGANYYSATVGTTPWEKKYSLEEMDTESRRKGADAQRMSAEAQKSQAKTASNRLMLDVSLGWKQYGINQGYLDETIRNNQVRNAQDWTSVALTGVKTVTGAVTGIAGMGGGGGGSSVSFSTIG